MKFKLPRHEISKQLVAFSYKAIKRSGEDVPRLSKDKLTQLDAVSRKIRREGLPKHLVLKKLKGKLGHGIFLHPKASPIAKGEVIAAYAGEVSLLPQNEGDNSDYVFSLISDLRLTRKEQQLFDPKRGFHPRRLYSLDLDAHKKGNFTRFINHSSKPNIEAHMLRTPLHSCEIIYIAKKTIRPGEQLLTCYEGDDNSYWGALKIKPFPMTPQTFQIS